MCDICPKVYCMKGCLGLDEVPAGRWRCAWHKCDECEQSAANTGGMLLRCCFCSYAVCNECRPEWVERVLPKV